MEAENVNAGEAAAVDADAMVYVMNVSKGSRTKVKVEWARLCFFFFFVCCCGRK